MPSPTIDQVLAAFERKRLAPRPVSWVHQMTLLLVTATMVLLPLLYLGLIGLVIYGTYTHGVIILGAMGALLMAKPFFIRPSKSRKPFLLDPLQQPEVTAFVHRVAETVGAPKPRWIELNCEVNAAAAFQDARSFFGRELKLVIGLPLVAGMNLRSFGGVLAHEFGHFSQGAGMRMTYLIRAINAWFTQAVYQKDAIDHALDCAVSRGWGILKLVQGFIWLTRRILAALMHLGQAMGCCSLRQMEFHADSYEIRFAGSDAFAVTSSRLERLEMGAQRARSFLAEIQGQGRVSSNFPDLALRQSDPLPTRLRVALEKNRDAAKTRWDHSHPCDADRIRAAAEWNDPGMFRLETPASALFRDFERLCEAVTRHFYEHQAEIPLAQAEWVDNEQLTREDHEMELEIDAINAFFHDRFRMHRPVFVTAEDVDARLGFAPLPSRLEDLDRLAKRLHHAFAQEEQLARSTGLEARLAEVRSHLAPYDCGARDLLLDALARRRRRGEDADLTRWLELMAVFQDIYGPLQELAGGAESLRSEIQRVAGDHPYPFPHAQGPVTLRVLLEAEPDGSQLLRLYQRVLGRLVIIAREEISAADRSRYVFSGIS